jgi:hypothetical protein
MIKNLTMFKKYSVTLALFSFNALNANVLDPVMALREEREDEYFEGRVRNLPQDVYIERDTRQPFQLGEFDFEKKLLTQVASILPPKVEGASVRTTKIIVHKSNLYASYNHEGQMYRGALESISLEDPKKLRLTSQILFPEADINALYPTDSFVYAVGARSKYVKSPGFISRYSLHKGRFITEGATLNELSGYAGTDVLAGPEGVIAVSGTDGGVSLFDKNMNLQWSVGIEDARSIAPLATQSSYVLLAKGLLYYLTSDILHLKGTYLGYEPSVEAKSSIQVDRSIIYAAVNNGGIVAICSRDKKIMGHLPAIVTESSPVEKTVTNSVAVIGDWVFTANGEAGLGLYFRSRRFYLKGVSSCGHVAFQPVGNLIVNRQGVSANHVTVEGNRVYVANGEGGIQIFQLNR